MSDPIGSTAGKRTRRRPAAARSKPWLTALGLIGALCTTWTIWKSNTSSSNSQSAQGDALSRSELEDGHRLFGERKYADARRKCAEVIQRAQSSSGSLPLSDAVVSAFVGAVMCDVRLDGDEATAVVLRKSVEAGLRFRNHAEVDDLVRWLREQSCVKSAEVAAGLKK